MSPTIRIDDEVFEALKGMGEAFVDTPNSVLRRVLKLENDQSGAAKQNLENKIEITEKKSTEDKFPVETGQKINTAINSKDVTTYTHPRLCFKSSFIEPLKEGDVFQVETAKDGFFRFTKAEFYRVFPNVINSVSYRENGIYHYPTIPRKALPYKVS